MTGSTEGCPSPALVPGRKGRVAHWACRWLLAVVFLVAGAGKVTDLAAFADLVLVHSAAPYYVGVVAAAWFPWLELTCGVCLALGYAIREVACILSVLLLGLLAYSLASFGDPAACGCFLLPVKTEWMPAWWPPTRNGGLLLVSLWLAWQRESRPVGVHGSPAESIPSMEGGNRPPLAQPEASPESVSPGRASVDARRIAAPVETA